MQDSIKQLVETLHGLGFMLVTAESCTGGLLSTMITDRPGASEVFERGFITYSNDAKKETLDVPSETLARYGAVSGQTAVAMVKGALNHSRAELAVSITGIAGPSGGSEEKPVGLVYIGYGLRSGSVQSVEHFFKGNRTEIREQAAETACRHLSKFLQSLP